MHENFPLKRIPILASAHTHPSASEFHAQRGGGTELLIRIRRENAEQSAKYRERCHETVVELLSVVHDSEVNPTIRTEVKAAILAVDARCRFDRDPCLAIAKFALGAGSANEERRAQKYATVLRFLHSNGAFGDAAKQLLIKFGIEGLATLSRAAHSKNRREKLKVKFSRTDRLNVRLTDAVEGMVLAISCKVTAIAPGEVCCELDVEPFCTTTSSK